MAQPRLRVGSFNIYNTTARYTEGRRDLLAAAVTGLRSSGGRLDVLGIQEVVFNHGGWQQQADGGPVVVWGREGVQWGQAPPLMTLRTTALEDPSVFSDCSCAMEGVR